MLRLALRLVAKGNLGLGGAETVCDLKNNNPNCHKGGSKTLFEGDL